MEVKVDDLKTLVALQGLPDHHLQWIIDHSEYTEHKDGDLLFKFGDPAEVMWISLAGKIAFYMYLNGRQVYYFTFENDNLTGGVGGIMPYSRMTTYPGYSYALGEVKLLRLHKKNFPELEALNPDFTQRLIGIMTERAKVFATTRLQLEKVNALGNLAAGIAHELNNPAAAIRGISNELNNRLNRNYELMKNLLQSGMTPEHLNSIRSLMESKESEQAENTKRTTLQRMGSEDELDDWLHDNGAATQRETAETFAEYGFTTSEMEDICSVMGRETFVQVIPWLENTISCQKMIKDLNDASTRISKLVGSIKSHVHMDRTEDLQATNIQKDLENTLTLLGFKLREKNIEVIKNFCENMPDVPAYVGELNQVWTNLIDNAIFAMDKNGKLKIETHCNDKNITVSIIDNGKGIPPDIISRIFDPFFTTKKMGEGTGIGLDIVSRIIKRHKGEIKVNSLPGRTEFSIQIPVQQPA